MSYLRIDCDASWEAVPAHQEAEQWLDPIPLTPRAAAWTVTSARVPNFLASALLGFLQLPIRHLTGTVVVTAYLDGRPRALDDQQLHAFTTALQALLAMPDYLALHAQAGRLAIAWSCPTIERSSS